MKINWFWLALIIYTIGIIISVAISYPMLILYLLIAGVAVATLEKIIKPKGV